MELTMEFISGLVDAGLLVAAVALYFIGMALKKTERLDNRFIPLVLGAIGIIIAAIFFFATTPEIASANDVAMLIFKSLVQGVAIAALPVYFNQNLKQLGAKG